MQSVHIALALATGLFVSAMADEPPWTYDTSRHVDPVPSTAISPVQTSFASLSGDEAESAALAELDSAIYSVMFLSGLNFDATPLGLLLIVR